MQHFCSKRTVAARPQRRPQPQRYCTCGTSRLFSALSGPSRPVVAQRQACQERHAQQGHQPPDNILQLRNLNSLPTRQDHGDLSLRHERGVDDLRWTATAGQQQYAAPSNHASVVAQHGRNDHAQELDQWEQLGLLHKSTVGTTSPLHNRGIDHQEKYCNCGVSMVFRTRRPWESASAPRQGYRRTDKNGNCWTSTVFRHCQTPSTCY